jgi:hypothetical protein
MNLKCAKSRQKSKMMITSLYFISGFYQCWAIHTILFIYIYFWVRTSQFLFLYKVMRTRLILFYFISFWDRENRPGYQDLYFFHTQLVPKRNNSHKCNNNCLSHSILIIQISNFHLLKKNSHLKKKKYIII